jgi:threonyl-tRNA synthetase
LEHYKGAMPPWLSPKQAVVVPITDDHNEYATKVADRLREAGLRAEADLSAERMNAKIRNAQLLKVPYMAVVGDREVEAETVSLRRRDGERRHGVPVAELVEMIGERVRGRAGEL